MRLQSGSMIVDFYPTKSWIDDVINEDKFLKVLTFRGQTIIKKVISTQDYINEVYDRIHNFKYVDNNVDHSNLHQFVSLKEV